jgi:BASS family bile acid:Na+ symporter
MTTAQWLGLGLQASIVLTVIGFGLTATLPQATYLFRNPRLLLRAVLSMNVAMPIVTAIIATTSSLPFEVKVALVMLAVSPVPPIVQKKQLASGGRMEYVVGLMVAMAVLAIVLVPLSITILAAVFDRPASVLPAVVAKTVLITVIVPLAVAIAVRHWFPTVEEASHAVMVVAGILLIVTVVLLVWGLWPVVRHYIGNGVVLMLAVIAVVGLVIGHLLGGPLAGDRTVLAMSTASRHPAVALAAATSGTQDPKAELAIILLYLVVATIITIPYQKWRARTAPG